MKSASVSSSSWALWLLLGATAYTITQSIETAEVESSFGGPGNNEGYLSWIEEKGDNYATAAYFAATSADPLDGAAIHWRLDGDMANVAVAVRATGWVGFGLADAGGMKGADIVYFETSKPGVLTDAYAVDKAMPLTDDCQDWRLVHSVQSADGFLIFEGVRRLDTGDVNDHPIIPDAEMYIAAQRMIFAWGDEPSISYHGIENIARGGIRWYGEGNNAESFSRRMAEYKYFDIFARNHSVKAIETDYVDFCYTWPDFLEQGVPATGSVTVVAAEMILDDVGGVFVHHATIVGSKTASAGNGTCLDPLSMYSYPLYGWAPGTLPFVMPEDVGFIIGPGDDGLGLQSFRINMHYNNPGLKEGFTDSGGLRVYYSVNPPKHEMGIFFLADPFTHLKGTSLGSGLSEFRFDCKSDCSALILDEPVTVVHEYFHMHGKGSGVVQQQIRNGEVIRQATTSFFDFDQSGIHGVRQPSYTIEPGDSFRTKCFYNNNDDNETVFGIGFRDEMCEGLLLYYPAKRYLDYPWGCVYDVPVPQCSAEFTYDIFPSNETSFRTFGVGGELNGGGEQCSAPVATSTSNGYSQTTSSVLKWAVLLACVSLLSIDPMF